MPQGSRLTGAGFALVLIASAGIYAPGLLGGFIFDDFPNLLDNPALHSLDSGLSGLWQAATSFVAGPTRRPLSMLSFAIQVREMGFDPWPLKAVNLIIHLSNGILVFFLTHRLARRAAIKQGEKNWAGGPEVLALATTAAWLLAPVNVSSVLYVVQRMELLATSLSLAGLSVYTLGRERCLSGDRRGVILCWIGLLLGTGLGTLAKESAALTPLYALAVEVAVYRFCTAGRCENHLLVLYALLLVAPGILALIWLMPGLWSGQAYAGRPFDLAQRLWTESRILWNYLVWILFPHPSALGFYHDDFPISTDWRHPWTTLPAALGIMALGGLGCYLSRRLPLAALGIFWFLAGHVLTATVIPLELVFEHRNYFPALGLLLAVLSAVLTTRLPLVAARSALAVAWIALFGLQTALSAAIWGDPVVLARTMAVYHPDSPRANYELGLTLTRFSQGPDSETFRQGMAVLTKAATLPSAGLLPDQALILLASRHGLAIEGTWWQRMRDRVTTRVLSSEDINALYTLIRCRSDGLCSFPPERLGEVLKAAITVHPKSGELITLYANYAANLARNFPLALDLMQQALSLQPRNVQYWVNLARLQIALRQPAARFSLERIAELSPSSSLLRELTTLFHKSFDKPWRPPYAS